MSHTIFTSAGFSSARLLMGFGALCLAALPVGPVQAAEGQRPALVITDSPIPASILEKAYNKPVQVRDITADELIGHSYYKPTDTMVSRKINDLQSELAILQDKVLVLSEALTKVQRQNEGKAAQYYAAVATINTQLQAGTTPGNPRLIERFATAERTLDDLGGQVTDLNQLALDTAKVATETSFLLDSARSAYSLSGAVEEDHIRLAKLEDKVSSTVVIVERLLGSIDGDLGRTNAYLAAERDNLRVLSLAISEGNFYGKSLANRPFSGTGNVHQASYTPPTAAAATAPTPVTPASPAPAPAPQSARPLVKITFDSANVEYEQPLYMAVNEALERYPDATFKVVGVHPAAGNAAETAIESTRARRNTKNVLRTLSQIGVSDNQIDVSYDGSSDVTANEVHVYIQ